MTKVEALKQIVAGHQEFFPEWREGQAYYLVLGWLAPDICDEILGTYRDPYDTDARIDSLLLWLKERWSND